MMMTIAQGQALVVFQEVFLAQELDENDPSNSVFDLSTSSPHLQYCAFFLVDG